MKSSIWFCCETIYRSRVLCFKSIGRLGEAFTCGPTNALPICSTIVFATKVMLTRSNFEQHAQSPTFGVSDKYPADVVRESTVFNRLSKVGQICCFEFQFLA